MKVWYGAQERWRCSQMICGPFHLEIPASMNTQPLWHCTPPSNLHWPEPRPSNWYNPNGWGFKKRRLPACVLEIHQLFAVV